MKKWIALLLCGVMMMLIIPAASAEETDADGAEVKLDFQADLPENCAQYAYRLSDGLITTRIVMTTGESFTITPDGMCNAMELGWYTVPQSYCVRQLDANGASVREETVSDGFVNHTIALESGCAAVFVTLLDDGAIGEVKAYSAPEITGDEAQGFLSTPDSVDLLIITAEPGMEWKQFGAVLPTYAKELGIECAVLYLSDYDSRARVDEALSGLLSVGLREYPVFGGFSCKNYDSYDIVSREWGESETLNYIVGQIETLSPKVIVTHGLEDATAAHRFVAERVLDAVEQTDSVQKLYLFDEAQSEDATVIPMDTPLSAFDGKTAAETAQAAFDLCTSQTAYGRSIDTASAYTLAWSRVGTDAEKNDLLENIDISSLLTYDSIAPSPEPTTEPIQNPQTTVEPAESTADAAEADIDGTEGFAALPVPALISLAGGAVLTALLLFSLYRPVRRRKGAGNVVCISLIPLAAGITACVLLAGNIGQISDTAEPTRSPAPAETTAGPAQTSEHTPEPTPKPTDDPVAAFEENYYRKDGDPEETVVMDSEHGHWAYRSDTLGVDIDKMETTNTSGEPVVYFVADIHIKDSSELRAGYGSQGHTGKGTSFPWLIARESKAVLLITGDGIINTDINSKGILIRDGRVYSSANAEDTLAIYPDLSMRIFERWETRANILMDDGVEQTFSFGPTLIKDGVVNDTAESSHLNRINARTGIGYIEPGHYIAIVVERWNNEYSVGMTLPEFAELFAENGCELAYNLVGGWSSAMVFMGEQLNGHIVQDAGEKNYGVGQRPIADALIFGYSELVPDEGE